MDLYMWLAKNRIGLKELAEMIHYDRGHVYGVLNGRLKPSSKFLSLVEHATANEVLARDIWKIHDEGVKKFESYAAKKQEFENYLLQKQMKD